MVTNSLLDIDMITAEALIVLKTKLGLGQHCLRKFDSSFGMTGAKIGDTIRLRKPVRFTTTTGPTIQAQNTVETYVPLAIQTQRGVNVSFTTKDRSLALGDYSDLILAPSMSQLATDVDKDGLASALGLTIATGAYAGTYPGVFNLATPGAISTTAGPAAWTGADVGSAATNSQTALTPFTQARARIMEQNSPTAEIYSVYSPAAGGATIPALSSAFNPSAEISKQYKEGIMGTAAGAMWYESQNLPTFTAGSWTNSANQQVNVTSVSGATSLVIKGSGSGAVIAVGDQFVVAGVHSVNPQTRASTGKLQVFVVTAAATAVSTDLTVSVYPVINNSGQYQTIDRLPTANDLVTFMGTSAASTTVNLFYQKNAFALGVAPLEDVSAYGPQCYRADTDEEEGGISLRMIQMYDPSTDQVLGRTEILYGWSLCRPELATRVQG